MVSNFTNKVDQRDPVKLRIWRDKGTDREKYLNTHCISYIFIFKGHHARPPSVPKGSHVLGQWFPADGRWGTASSLQLLRQITLTSKTATSQLYNIPQWRMVMFFLKCQEPESSHFLQKVCESPSWVSIIRVKSKVEGINVLALVYSQLQRYHHSKFELQHFSLTKSLFQNKGLMPQMKVITICPSLTQIQYFLHVIWKDQNKGSRVHHKKNARHH